MSYRYSHPCFTEAKRCCCFAHICRYFYEAIPKGHKDDISEPAVQGVLYCDKLFSIDRHCREAGHSIKQRYNYRNNHAKPILDSFITWINKQKPEKGCFEKAVTYAKNLILFMYNYLEDGRCSLSNNLSENSIRPFVVGRKNWLFSDTHAGAEASTICYTIIEMAKAHGINPYAYLLFLLENRPNKKMTDDELTSFAPWNKVVKEQCIKIISDKSVDEINF